MNKYKNLNKTDSDILIKSFIRKFWEENSQKIYDILNIVDDWLKYVWMNQEKDVYLDIYSTVIHNNLKISKILWNIELWDFTDLIINNEDNN